MPQTMKAVDIKDGAGPPSSLFINSEVPKPEPDATQCLIHVKAFGLNRADTMQREGKYPVPAGVTKIMGLEFSGVVEQVGHGKEEEERHNWKDGDEVFGLAYGGAYSEYVCVSKKMLIKKPKELSWEVTGGACETWFTALQALYLVGQFDPSTTKSVLWHAGASGVSIAGQQLSLHASTPPPAVFATARRDEKCSFCVDTLGATAAINTTKTPEWAAAIKKANGDNGVDLIVDYIGAPYFQQNLDVLNLDGRVVQLGTMGGTSLPEGTDIGAFVRKRARFMGSTLRSRSADYQGKLRDLFEEKVLQGLTTGTFKNPVAKVFKMEEIREAHEMMEANETQGKIICTVAW